jgi:amidohydrolase
MMTEHQIRNLVSDKNIIVEWRRHIHRHPETFGEESQTAAFIQKELKKLGLKIIPNVFENGFAAVLEGDPTKKCVAVRADMDALPITEQTGFDFASENPGKMHACGHDGHMSIMMGVAKALVENKPQGTVKFIFQPREEKPPGGAKFMIENGVLKNPDVDAIFGCHVNPKFPTGTVAMKVGTIMAVADDFFLHINGKGGHGSAPHSTIDPILVAAECVVALQSIVSRMSNPMHPLVISFGEIRGGTSQNIIPDEVYLTGTLRCLSNHVRDRAVAEMKRILNGVTEAWGAGYKLDYLYAYPPLNNDAEMIKVVENVVEKLGEKDLPGIKTEIMPYSLLAGEDFAYYSQQVPAAYFMLGCEQPGQVYPWHHACFTLNEECLPIGANVIANAVSIVASRDK